MSKISFIFNFFDEISRKVPPGKVVLDRQNQLAPARQVLINRAYQELA